MSEPLGDILNTDALRRAQRLLEISVKLNSTLDQEKLLQYIIETAADVLECAATSILLFDDERKTLRFVAATGSDPHQLAKIPVPLNGSIAGSIFVENRVVVVNDVEKDPRHFKKVGKKVKFETHNLVGVPMSLEDEPIGVIQALNKRSGGFTDEDVEMLTVIASQAAVAIRNARQVEALQQAYDELFQLDQLKSEFIAIASHELRTPMTVILGYSQILREEVDPAAVELIDAVVEAGRRMSAVIEAMTDMNTLHQELTSLSLQPAVLQDLMRSAVDEIRPIAETKAQHFQDELPENALIVRADGERLRLALINILRNAVEFTDDDGTITFRALVPEEPGHIEIQVQDTGVGLAEDELEKIFKDFYQVEDYLTRSHGGLGLGLTIARKIVALHDGRIWASSPGPGQGATFHLLIPTAVG